MSSAFKRITLELRKLTPRERNFIFNFMATKTGNRSIDNRNLLFDLNLYRYKNTSRLKRLFEMMYDLSDIELKKLSKAFGIGRDDY